MKKMRILNREYNKVNNRNFKKENIIKYLNLQLLQNIQLYQNIYIF